MASQAGFEPATSPLGGARAIQLCHWDVRALYKNANKNKQLRMSVYPVAYIMTGLCVCYLGRSDKQIR